MIRAALGPAAALALLAAAPAPARSPHPLFAADEPIRLTLSGPIGAIRRAAQESTAPRDATLSLAGPAPETHAVRLAARGLSRRRREICAFPPLRLEFPAAPPAGSLFRGQRRLKLVTHCRAAADFQQYVLLEYAAYRLLNALTPHSLRVRLAQIDYVEASGGPALSRLGFLIEDVDDAARRNGLVEIDVERVDVRRISPTEGGRYAVFQYMIGNLDWAMQLGPPGRSCCHNSRLLAPSADAVRGLVPLPYDFDHSGLVDAPYATPPEQVPVRSVRARRYRGFCAHNEAALEAAAAIRADRARLLAVLDSVPQLAERSRRRAAAYLETFFADIATDAAVRSNLLRDCLG